MEGASQGGALIRHYMRPTCAIHSPRMEGRSGPPVMVRRFAPYAPPRELHALSPANARQQRFEICINRRFKVKHKKPYDTRGASP